MTNAERAKQWLWKNETTSFYEEAASLTALLDAVRLDEAEWWLRLVDGLELDEETAAHERMAQLRANSNQAKEQK